MTVFMARECWEVWRKCSGGTGHRLSVLRGQGQRRAATEMMGLNVQVGMEGHHEGQVLVTMEGMGGYIDAWFRSYMASLGNGGGSMQCVL